MKKTDYILISILAALAIAGIFIKGYFGGFITGSCAATLLFVTVGKLVYLKAKKRMDDLNEAVFRASKNLTPSLSEGEGEGSKPTNK